MSSIEKHWHEDHHSEKSTLVKIGNILLKAGISSTPLGSIGVATLETFQAIRDNLLETKEQRDQLRTELFIKSFLRGDINDTSVESFLDQLVSPDDFYILFRNALQDDEDQKAPHYAELLRNIALGNVPDEIKLFMINIAKRLSKREIKLLAQLQVINEYSIIPSEGPVLETRMLLKNKGIADKASYANLVSLGLLDEREGELLTNELSQNVAKMLFSKTMLTPQFFGYQTWRGVEALILVIAQDQSPKTLALQLQKVLRVCRVRSMIAFLNNGDHLSRRPLGWELLIIISQVSSRDNFFVSAKAALDKIDFSNCLKAIKIFVESNGDTPIDIAVDLQADIEITTISESCDLPKNLVNQINHMLDFPQAHNIKMQKSGA
jgi:hypothetical protein